MFSKGKTLLKNWEHFQLGWAFTNAPKIQKSASVIVVANSFGLWSINPLRITKANVNESLFQKLVCPKRKVGFSHRTLRGHQIRGEETFVIEWKRDDSVWYRIETVSGPDTTLAKVAYPVLSFLQWKFKKDSVQRMVSMTKQS